MAKVQVSINQLPKYSYQAGSCITCGQGTDTAFAIEGEAEWHAAVLIKQLKLDQNIVLGMIATGCDPGKVPAGVFTAAYRLCGDCAEEYGVPVALRVNDNLPGYRQRP